jgi:peptidoglycan/LPS O-acetylase OafA/YrhL
VVGSRPAEVGWESLRMTGLVEPSRPEASHINLEIEYLRAIAVLMVVLVHSESLFPPTGLGQWTGVDLFFCISGYVISRTFLPYFDRYIAEGRWWSAAKAFWVRRIFRLAPSAWLGMAIVALCSLTFNQSGSFYVFEHNLKAAGYFITLTTNFVMAYGNLHSNAIYWSLVLEDQFYLTFPFFLFLFRRQWRWIILLLLIFLQAIPDRSISGPLPGYLWVTRLDALMWGGLVYQFSCSSLYRKLEPVFCRFRIVALAINVALIYLLLKLTTDQFRPYVGSRAESQVALVSAALVFLASFERGYVLPVPRWLQAVLAWIGQRSYGIYLIHIMVFGFAKELWLRSLPLLGEDPTTRRYFYAAVIIVLTPLLAELNFWYVEKPWRDRGKRIANRILAKPEPRLQAAE